MDRNHLWHLLPLPLQPHLPPLLPQLLPASLLPLLVPRLLLWRPLRPLLLRKLRPLLPPPLMLLRLLLPLPPRADSDACHVGRVRARTVQAASPSDATRSAFI